MHANLKFEVSEKEIVISDEKFQIRPSTPYI